MQNELRNQLRLLNSGSAHGHKIALTVGVLRFALSRLTELQHAQFIAWCRSFGLPTDANEGVAYGSLPNLNSMQDLIFGMLTEIDTATVGEYALNFQQTIAPASLTVDGDLAIGGNLMTTQSIAAAGALDVAGLLTAASLVVSASALELQRDPATPDTAVSVTDGVSTVTDDGVGLTGPVIGGGFGLRDTHTILTGEAGVVAQACLYEDGGRGLVWRKAAPVALDDDIRVLLGGPMFDTQWLVMEGVNVDAATGTWPRHKKLIFDIHSTADVVGGRSCPVECQVWTRKTSQIEDTLGVETSTPVESQRKWSGPNGEAHNLTGVPRTSGQFVALDYDSGTGITRLVIVPSDLFDGAGIAFRWEIRVLVWHRGAL